MTSSSGSDVTYSADGEQSANQSDPHSKSYHHSAFPQSISLSISQPASQPAGQPASEAVNQNHNSCQSDHRFEYLLVNSFWGGGGGFKSPSGGDWLNKQLVPIEGTATRW